MKKFISDWLFQLFSEINIFRKFGDDSLVLCAVENGLWELGRVTARDGDELAVKLNKSGKEISTNLEKIVPIEEDEIRDQKGEGERILTVSNF